MGVVPFDQREAISSKWFKFCSIEHFDVVAFLCSEIDHQKWKTMGLPATKMAAENASIMFSTTETPFIIDSSGSVSAFLTKLYKDKEVIVLKPTQDDFVTQVNSKKKT